MADADPPVVPSEPTETMDTAESLKQLSSLEASAIKEYSLKNYGAAAELYSEATELQTEIRGEMSPENADLLYAYGRCLYHVAVGKSDVLGGQVAGEGPPKKKKKVKKALAPADGEQKLAEEVVEAVVEEKDGVKEDEEEEGKNKPFFSITGDENWTDDEDEEVDDGAEGAEAEDDEEDDDFAIAYEILDVARVLFSRRLEETSNGSKGKAADTDQSLSADQRTIMERLSDTHDLQAEISLENERFTDAVTDSRSALELKLRLFPKESSLVAEAHYKLSLALEFASVTTVETEGPDAAEQAPEKAQVDEEARKEAAEQMELAIESCKLRVTKEKTLLPTLEGEKAADKQRSVKDVEEMISDMEQRLVDLRNPAVNLNGVTGPAGAPDGSNPLGGLLGSILGESPAQQKARIEEAARGANDLTGLVRHKKPAAAVTAAAVKTEGNGVASLQSSGKQSSGKRKLEDETNGDGGLNGKRAKVEDI